MPFPSFRMGARFQLVCTTQWPLIVNSHTNAGPDVALDWQVLMMPHAGCLISDAVLS